MTNIQKKSQEGRLIGALLRVPFLTVVDRIYHRLHTEGFNDITYAHLAVFRHIDEEKGSRLIDLAEDAQITKQSMGYLVDSLEDAGYVERTADDHDGRVRLIRLTERGEGVMYVARKVVRNLEEEWAAFLGRERMDCLLDALRDLTTMLEEKQEASQNSG